MQQRNAKANIVDGPWSSSSSLSSSQAKAAVPARTPERRRVATGDPDVDALRTGLTPAQLVTLEAMEIFRWRLAFVRRPMFQAPIPVLYDKDGTRYVVILEDGTLDEHPTLKVRG